MKNQGNTTGLKIAFIPQTNNNGNRYKITQLNNCKSVYICGNLNCRIENLIAGILDNIPEVKNYSFMVDNTQNKHYFFNVDFTGNSFENILHNFKNL